ncbi:uncharacterized protein LOC142234129 isoform X2 [Haematobia irritans]|uniref:uncharacterized protein LOC142234129 isoform X2 n=1 Tax=Haematobia irritans TaxID=7368 RepID=UPI003F4FC607
MEQKDGNLTLGDLVTIALGGTNLTCEHLGILQNVLLLLLRKLGCEEEKVQIYGFDGKCLKEILGKCQQPLIKMSSLNKETFQTYFTILEDLNTRVQAMQQKLDRHFAEIKSRCASNEFKARFWDIYASPTEDLCTLYSEYNKEFCTMAQNPTFNREMRRRVTKPVLERMQIFEEQIEEIRGKLQGINVMADKANEKLKILPSLIGEIESKRHEIDKQQLVVRQAINEIEEMLNSKLDRITLPALRKYMEHRFQAIDDHISSLKNSKFNCPSATKLDFSNENYCISCSRDNALKPQFKQSLNFAYEQKCPIALPKKEPSLLDRMDKIKVKTYKIPCLLHHLCLPAMEIVQMVLRKNYAVLVIMCIAIQATMCIGPKILWI